MYASTVLTTGAGPPLGSCIICVVSLWTFVRFRGAPNDGLPPGECPDGRAGMPDLAEWPSGPPSQHPRVTRRLHLLPFGPSMAPYNVRPPAWLLMPVSAACARNSIGTLAALSPRSISMLHPSVDTPFFLTTSTT